MTRSRAAIFLLALGPWGAISACGDDQTTDVVDTPPPPLATGTTTGASSGSTGPASEPTVCGVIDGGTATDTGADGGTTASTGSDTDSPGMGSGSDPSAGCFCSGEFVVGGERPQTSFCQSECIPSGAVGQWCWDDESCCEGPCRPDGLCGELVTSGGSTSGATGTDTGSSSETMGSSSDSGSSSSSGSGESSTGGSGSSTG